jgi:hypothetical protein
MWLKMSDIFGKLKSGAEKVAKEADRITHIKRVELEIGSIKKQIEDQEQKLGEMVYKSSVNKEPENPEAAGIIAKITEMYEQIRVKEEEIKKVNQGESEPQAPTTPSKKLCTSCGKENDAGVKFCSECGAKLG